MPKRTQSYRSWQMEKLADPKRASSYLNAALQDSTESFLIALGKVAQARQMAKVAKDAGVQRETLYRSLSSQGNPTLDTLSSILKAVGLKISIGMEGDEDVAPHFPSGSLVHPILTGEAILEEREKRKDADLDQFWVSALTGRDKGDSFLHEQNREPHISPASGNSWVLEEALCS